MGFHDVEWKMFKQVMWWASAAFALSSPAVQAEPGSDSASSVEHPIAGVAGDEQRSYSPGLGSIERETRVSLEQVLRYADEHAPRLSVARAGVAMGRARVASARPWLPSDPVLSGTVGRRETNAGAGVDYSIAVQQELDLLGRRGATLRAARAELRARDAEVLAARWIVHQETHAAFHQSLIARERLHVARRVLRFAERLLEVASQRFAAGETSQLPVRIAEAELAQAKQAIMLAESDDHRVRLGLAQIVGWKNASLLTPAGKLDPPRVPPPARHLIALAKEEQPALQAARSRLLAAEARLAAARKKAWPNPTLGISYENEANPGTLPARIVAGKLSIPLPLWVGNAADRAVASAEIEQSRAEQGALVTTLDVQIVQARERVAANARRAQVFGTEILPTLETNLELLQKAFELGEIDVLQVMVAQERFLRTQQDALQSFADYYSAWAELEAIVGVELDSTEPLRTTGSEGSRR